MKLQNAKRIHDLIGVEMFRAHIRSQNQEISEIRRHYSALDVETLKDCERELFEDYPELRKTAKREGSES